MHQGYADPGYPAAPPVPSEGRVPDPIVGTTYASQPAAAPVYTGAPVIVEGVPVRHHRGEYDCLSVVVCLVGFIFCPVWCLGFLFVRKGGLARVFGVMSVILALLAIIAAIIIAVTVPRAIYRDTCHFSRVDDCLSRWRCGWCLGNDECTSVNECNGAWMRDVRTVCNSYDSDLDRCNNVPGCQDCGDRYCEPDDTAFC